MDERFRNITCYFRIFSGRVLENNLLFSGTLSENNFLLPTTLKTSFVTVCQETRDAASEAPLVVNFFPRARFPFQFPQNIQFVKPENCLIAVTFSKCLHLCCSRSLHKPFQPQVCSCSHFTSSFPRCTRKGTF